MHDTVTLKHGHETETHLGKGSGSKGEQGVEWKRESLRSEC